VRFKDHFSDQAADYARYRPDYPHELFAYLGSLVFVRECAWDCGTGSGQAAVALAEFFDRVVATDASEKQILSATKSPRVEYRIAPAENSGLSSHSLDLIAVAQALHWFDLDRFYLEARRVLKPNGAFAASAYLVAQIEPAVDAVVNQYYSEVVGPFWAPERRLVENFADIPFPFHKIDPPKFEMMTQWNLEYLVGYLRSWSSTQRFITARDSDPLDEIADELRAAWGNAKQTRRVIWPLTLRVGIKAIPESLAT